MQNMLKQGPDFWRWFDTTQFSYDCVHPINGKMFSIQTLLHFSQIVPRVCTSVLFICYCNNVTPGVNYVLHMYYFMITYYWSYNHILSTSWPENFRPHVRSKLRKNCRGKTERHSSEKLELNQLKHNAH